MSFRKCKMFMEDTFIPIAFIVSRMPYFSKMWNGKIVGAKAMHASSSSNRNKV